MASRCDAGGVQCLIYIRAALAGSACDFRLSASPPLRLSASSLATSFATFKTRPIDNDYLVAMQRRPAPGRALANNERLPRAPLLTLGLSEGMPSMGIIDDQVGGSHHR